VRWSRSLEGAPKTVTLSREADGWYACFSCEGVAIQPLPLTGQQTGIDLGLESFATLADGSQIANPRIFRVAERKLKRAQRRVSRRQKGSHRRRKAVQLLAPGASAGAPGASRLPPQGGALPRPAVRHHQLRRLADGQPAQKPPSGEVYGGCRMACVPEHPRFQGSRCREVGSSRAACLYEPALLWPHLWDHPRQRLVGALARLPRVRYEPTLRPQRRQEHRTAGTEPSGRRGVGRVGEPRISRF
jgi:hypothetical protein